MSAIPHIEIAFPWDSPTAADPVVALTAAREALGDTFVVGSGGTTYLFVFANDALRNFYEIPERTASKGLADYRMLLRKLPPELFEGRRTFAHDLFGASDVTSYLSNVDFAIAVAIAELDSELHKRPGSENGAGGRFDAFQFARRLGHRIGITSWFGREAPFEQLVAHLDELDGADAFVHPETMKNGIPERELLAMAAVSDVVERLLNTTQRTPSFLDFVAQRWDDKELNERLDGIAYDLILLHVATMTNLFAAIGWTIALAALHGDQCGDLDHLALEATRLGQRSLISREVLRATEFDDGQHIISLMPGSMLATMAPITNRVIPNGNDFDPSRWTGPLLRNDISVTTFGHGPHRCPAQRFSMQAIVRTTKALLDRYELTARFDTVHPLPLQIGGIARSAKPCEVEYRPRRAARLAD